MVAVIVFFSKSKLNLVLSQELLEIIAVAIISRSSNSTSTALYYEFISNNKNNISRWVALLWQLSVLRCCFVVFLAAAVV